MLGVNVVRSRRGLDLGRTLFVALPLLLLYPSACGSITRKGLDASASDTSVFVDAPEGGTSDAREGGASDAREGGASDAREGGASDAREGGGADAREGGAGDAPGDARAMDGASGDAGGGDRPPCTAVAEQCNGRDDDCDGVIDDGCPMDQAIISTSAKPVQSVVFGSITQSGTSSFAAPCPDGQEIIALTGNAGSAIDSVGVKCGLLRVREDRTTTPYSYSVAVEAGDAFDPQGGNGGVAQGIDGVLGCHVNEVVVSVQAWSPDVTGTCATDYCPSGVKDGCTTVSGLAVTCASYSITGAPGSFALALGTGRASTVAGSGEATGRKSQTFACAAPGAVHRLDGVKGPFLSNCASPVVQGLRATCTTPALPLR